MPSFALRLPLLALLASQSLFFQPVASHPYPKDDLHDQGDGFLMPRGCVNYCGYNNQYCCAAEQECFTSANIAGCRNTVAGGGFNMYTTTWTQTETFTSTFSSYFPAATVAATETCVPEAGSGQIACGNICCANWQYCAYAGQCMANVAATAAPTVEATTTATYTTEGTTVTTTGYSAPYRVTSGSTVVVGGGGGAATTAETTSFETASSTTGTALGATSTGNVTVSTNSDKGLSGGAIAGIVIGTLAGVCLLIALCACCIIRGLWNTVLAVLGLGGRRRRREDVTVIEEERIHHHGGGGASHHGGWFGRRPSTRVNEKHDHNKAWLGAGALGTLALLLGLRKHHKDEERRRHGGRSDVSSTYYTGSYLSSGYSSRDSRRSRGTRGSRRTDYTRASHMSRPSRQHR